MLFQHIQSYSFSYDSLLTLRVNVINEHAQCGSSKNDKRELVPKAMVPLCLRFLNEEVVCYAADANRVPLSVELTPYCRFVTLGKQLYPNGNEVTCPEKSNGSRSGSAQVIEKLTDQEMTVVKELLSEESRVQLPADSSVKPSLMRHNSLPNVSTRQSPPRSQVDKPVQSKPRTDTDSTRTIWKLLDHALYRKPQRAEQICQEENKTVHQRGKIGRNPASPRMPARLIPMELLDVCCDPREQFKQRNREIDGVDVLDLPVPVFVDCRGSSSAHGSLVKQTLCDALSQSSWGLDVGSSNSDNFPPATEANAPGSLLTSPSQNQIIEVIVGVGQTTDGGDVLAVQQKLSSSIELLRQLRESVTDPLLTPAEFSQAIDTVRQYLADVKTEFLQF